MADYEIHTVIGDEPYVTMHGDFSADQLNEILEEMLDAKKSQNTDEPWACDECNNYPNSAKSEACENCGNDRPRA